MVKLVALEDLRESGFHRQLSAVEDCIGCSVFFFNETATTEIYTVRNTLSLHDALPIPRRSWSSPGLPQGRRRWSAHSKLTRSEEHTSEFQSLRTIPYAVFCLKKKKDMSSVANDFRPAFVRERCRRACCC